MAVLEAKNYINKAIISHIEKKNLAPEEMIDKIKGKVFVYLDDDQSVKNTPRIGYIKSNIKGHYYIIYCDSCNARCRKVYPTKINMNNDIQLKFLCGKCAGRKYERKKEYEKKALEYLLHPERMKYIDFDNIPLKDCLAILEAGFIKDKIRQRAEKNLSRYIN